MRASSVRTPLHAVLSIAAVLAVICFPGTAAALVSTTTTVVATPSSSTYGQSVQFDSTVTGISGSPRNGVSIMEGATVIATQNVNGQGHAISNVTTLSVGSHTLTAVYAGNAASAGSSSAPFSFVVSKATSTTTMTVPSAVAYGVAAPFTATVTGPGAIAPTGTVTFTESGNTICSASLALVAGTPTATCNGTGLSAGDHTILASYGGDGSYNTSDGATRTQTINLGATSTAVGSSANPSSATTSVTFTATITGAGTLGGSVDFYDDATKLNDTPISVTGGTAQYSTSALSVGSHPITAQYLPDSNHSGSTSSILSQTVDLAATTTALISDASPVTAGTNVTFTATVSSLIPGTLTGTVDFYDGATKLNDTGVTIVAGVATYSTTALNVATHSITAVYSGDSVYATSTSSAVSQVINLAPTTTTVVALPNPATVGNTVTITATVTSAAAGTITGTVDFYDGATKLNDTGVAVTAGQAAYQTSALTAGSHSITAVYSGDATYDTSTSSADNLNVRDTSSTTLGSTPNPAKVGTTIVFTATVSPNTATGTVDLVENNVTIASGPVSSGVATINVSVLAAGSHTIEARYSGDSSYAPSTSTSVIQAVTSIPRSDLNNDGHSDIVLQNTITSSIAAWLMSSNAILQGKVVANPVAAWRLQATGDLDGDGKADLILQNNVSGAIAFWRMNGTVLVSGTIVTTTSTNWRIVGARDFDADGKADIVVQNMVTGDVDLWTMSSGAIVSDVLLGNVSANTRVVGLGRLGGNAVVLQDTTTGAISRWIVSGGSVTSNQAIGTPSAADIKVLGVADFNSDGNDDLVLQSASARTVSVWLLSSTGIGVLSSGNVATPVAGWAVVGSGDYDGDGFGDILLHNSITNGIAEWQMNGTVIARGWNVGTLAGWKPLGN